MTKQADKERQEAIEQLRKWLKPGDTVYTILHHVSRSGMQRQISVVVLLRDDDDGSIIDLHPNYSVAKATGYRLTAGAHDTLTVNGTGMDMGFDVVYNLSRVLFPEYQCLGPEKCPSNEHVNNRGKASDVYGKAVGHKDGYALSHRWL